MEQEIKDQTEKFIGTVEELLNPPFKLEEVAAVLTEGGKELSLIAPSADADENYVKLTAIWAGADESQKVVDRIVAKWKSQFGDTVERFVVEQAVVVVLKVAAKVATQFATP